MSFLPPKPKMWKCKSCGNIYVIKKDARKHVREIHKIRGGSNLLAKGGARHTSEITSKLEPIDFEEIG